MEGRELSLLMSGEEPVIKLYAIVPSDRRKMTQMTSTKTV